jgi:hypothetical protein
MRAMSLLSKNTFSPRVNQESLQPGPGTRFQGLANHHLESFHRERRILPYQKGIKQTGDRTTEIVGDTLSLNGFESIACKTLLLSKPYPHKLEKKYYFSPTRQATKQPFTVLRFINFAIMKLSSASYSCPFPNGASIASCPLCLC